MDTLSRPKHPRGRPFPKGNPGRKRGSRNRLTLLREALLRGEVEPSDGRAILSAIVGRSLPKNRPIPAKVPEPGLGTFAPLAQVKCWRAQQAVMIVRRHAAEVLALFVHGGPQIDEQLWIAQRRARAVMRVLYGPETERRLIQSGRRVDGEPVELFYSDTMLACLPGEDDAEKFARIFAAAPAWLLKYTAVDRDAMLLGFQLRDLSGGPQLGAIARGQRDAWPYLPGGTIDAGGSSDGPDYLPSPRELWARFDDMDLGTSIDLAGLEPYYARP